MVLWDGSPHRWFGKKVGPRCLMAAMDDATGKVLDMFFAPCESIWAYLTLLERVVRGHGIPASVYQDKNSALKRNDDFWSIEKQLEGRPVSNAGGSGVRSPGEDREAV